MCDKHTSGNAFPLLPSEQEAQHQVNAAERKRNAAPKKPVRRGDIYFADLSPVVGSEQGGVRPVLIVQNNMGNKHSPTVIVAPITAQENKKPLPTHVEIHIPGSWTNIHGTALLEQIRTIDKQRLKQRVSHASNKEMDRITNALAISLDIK